MNNNFLYFPPVPQSRPLSAHWPFPLLQITERKKSHSQQLLESFSLNGARNSRLLGTSEREKNELISISQFVVSLSSSGFFWVKCSSRAIRTDDLAVWTRFTAWARRKGRKEIIRILGNAAEKTFLSELWRMGHFSCRTPVRWCRLVALRKIHRPAHGP